MMRRRARISRLGRLIGLLLVAVPGDASPQVLVKVNEDVNFRLGVLLQGWGDWTQDPVSEGYAQNFFFRRVRFLVAGNIARNVSFFFQTENSRLGNAGLTGARSLNAGFAVQDAFGEWRFAGDAGILDAGLVYTPQSRGALNGSSSTLTFDAPTFSQQQSALAQASAGRDIGLMFKGYLVGDHLEYRAGAFSGLRQPATAGSAGSRNGPRVAARLQYDVFDVEKGYIYVGTNRGTRKILAIGTWGDAQGDFKSWGADVMADIPVAKDAVTLEADYGYYNGGREFQSVAGQVVTPLLPGQDTFFAHAGYYFHAVALQPFFRFETLNFRDERFRAANQKRYSGGLNWYVSAQNFKITPFYERVVPRDRPATTSIKNTSHFGVQLQFFYF